MELLNSGVILNKLNYCVWRRMCYFIGAPMKSALLLALVAVAAVLSSCNTTIGLGRDMRILGDGMEKSANKTRGSTSGGSGDTSGAPVY